MGCATRFRGAVPDGTYMSENTQTNTIVIAGNTITIAIKNGDARDPGCLGKTWQYFLEYDGEIALEEEYVSNLVGLGYAAFHYEWTGNNIIMTTGQNAWCDVTACGSAISSGWFK